MSVGARAASAAPSPNRQEQRHTAGCAAKEHRSTDDTFQRLIRVWNTMPTLVGIPAVQTFASNELGVELTRSLLRHATEQRRIEVFKVSARNAYSEAGVVRFIESLARPVADQEAQG